MIRAEIKSGWIWDGRCKFEVDDVRWDGPAEWAGRTKEEEEDATDICAFPSPISARAGNLKFVKTFSVVVKCLGILNENECPHMT